MFQWVKNVGASPDGRNALTPLADGGMSPVYGRDMAGPTAVLKIGITYEGFVYNKWGRC